MADNAVFVAGGADTQVALHQTDIQIGDIAIVSGTTSPVVSLVDTLYYDPGQRVWTNSNLGADGYVIEMNPGVTGLNYQRIKGNFLPDISYEKLKGFIQRKRSFSALLRSPHCSFMNSVPFERRILYAVSMSDSVDRIDMAWAVLADIACSIYEQLYRCQSLPALKKLHPGL